MTLVSTNPNTNERQAEQAQLDELYQNECFRLMNNLYLEIESGKVAMSLHFRLTLENLLAEVYPAFEQTGIINPAEYWMDEFQKLPGWLDF